MNDRRDHEHPFRDHDADAFVDGVLGRTSGKACGRALDQLDALLDGELHGLDRRLVQAHLEHCPGCSSVAVTLGWLGPALPAMAVLDPGPAFTARVLDRTVRARVSRSAPAHPGGLAGLMDRVGRWWEEQILRPAFATQVAYVATVLVVLATATPWSPLRGAPGRALEIVSAGPREVPVVGPALVGAGEWLETGAASVTGAGRARAEARRGSLVRAWEERRERSAPAREELKTHLETAATRARAGALSEAGYEVLAAARSGRTAWTTWWHASDEHGPSGP
ncbi:zf-HC2 domain-containing protein [bacterium]|nr:zf-HC2 domain-containing protein [bacterium]